jgi:hypothetical protein
LRWHDDGSDEHSFVSRHGGNDSLYIGMMMAIGCERSYQHD